MNIIKKLRESKGMTQKALAHRLGVERSTVAKWETGEATPRSDKLLEIAKIFGCTIDDLFADAAG